MSTGNSREMVGQRIVLENDRIRVWEETIAVGEETPMHTHSHPFVAVIVEGGVAEAVSQTGEANRRIRRPGQVLFTDADALPLTHLVRNVGETSIRLVIVELLQ